MRKMRDSGIEWIGLIPEEWKVLPHKYVMHKVKDIQEHYSGEDIISLSMNGVIVRDLTAGGKMPTTFDGYQKVYEGNLLQCLFDIDVTPRCVGLIKSNGVTSPAYSQFSLHDNAYAAYYDYLLRYMDDNKVLVHLAKNLRSSLTETDFGAILTILPPIQVQSAIAAYLDRKCAEIDGVVRDTEATIEEYKKLKQSLITEVVTGKKRVAPDGLSLSNEPRKMKDSGVEWIGDVPVEWEALKVKWVLAERNDRSVNGEEEPLSMSQKYGIIPTKQMDIVPNMASSFVNAKLVRKGDLVFNKLKAHLGVFSTSKYDGLVSPDYAVYYSTGKSDVEYLEYLFKTPQCIYEFKKYITGVGSGLSRLYTSDLFNIYCPIPDKEEQNLIKTYLVTKCTEIDRLIESKQNLLKELDTYKKSLIYECVTGKREVN